MHILIVESDRILGSNIAAALKMQGHGAIYTPDAQAAINAADAKTPDVIILDLLLAGRSGIEFLYEMRSYPDWQSIPVIVYSSLVPGELLSDCDIAQLGIHKILHKPTTRMSELIEEVRLLTKPATI